MERIIKSMEEKHCMPSQEPVDAVFTEHDMNLEFYHPFLTKDYLMGPNSLRILKELLEKNPKPLGTDSLILDLGCGTGLTSFALCKETGAKVLANDLWISAEENAARFSAWGVGDKVTPVHENADHLHFEKECFDAIVSIDSYHYFAGSEGYFQEKILPFLKPGGIALFGVPGIREEFDGRTEELLSPWAGNESYMFRSPRQWRKILGESPDMASAQVMELDCFDSAWQDWLATDHEYARGDAAFWEGIIRPYTNFVGMIVRRK